MNKKTKKKKVVEKKCLSWSETKSKRQEVGAFAIVELPGYNAGKKRQIVLYCLGVVVGFFNSITLAKNKVESIIEHMEG